MRPFDLDLMNYRKLRIAWSVGWGILCPLLIVLWVRSFWCWDELRGRTSIDQGFQLYSFQGRVEWYNWYIDRSNKLPLEVRTISGKELPSFLFPPKRQGLLRLLDFHFLSNGNFTVLASPHWFFVVVCGALAAAPLDAMEEALQPPHAAHRDDGGCAAAGCVRMGGEMNFGTGG